MSFLDGWFYAALALVVIVYWLAPVRARMPFLLASSVGWLAYASPETLAVFAAAGGFTWAGTHWIARAPDKPAAKRRHWLMSGAVLAAVVAARIWFRGAFATMALSLDPAADTVLKLLGVAYLVLKVHHCFMLARVQRTAPLGFFDLLHYLLYIPTLSSGPILRVREWQALANCSAGIPPASSPTSLQNNDRQLACATITSIGIEAGLKRMVWGLFKKTVVVALMIDASVMLSHNPALAAHAAVLVLAVLTIYFDFSGYCDIAIGVARLFGHRLPENFRHPFRATSLSQFWRNWHITMGDWLRDHIFIPWGGMRASRTKGCVLVFFIMLFCGLWHAFELRFVLWGTYYGVLMAGELALDIRPLPPGRPRRVVILRRAAVFALISFGAIFFIPEYW